LFAELVLAMLYGLLLVVIAAAAGHVVFWASVVNRTHGLGIHRRTIDAVTVASAVMMAAVPLAIAAVFWMWSTHDATWGGVMVWGAVWTYLGAMAACAIYALANHLWRVLHHERRGALVENHTSRVDLRSTATGPLAAPGIPALIAHLPLNEVFDLHMREKRLTLPRISSELPSLRIAHISDLHMSGRIHREYFERAVDEANRLEPDLIAITGDLVDREACIAWLPETLGKLRAPAGVYYVRGNHDRRVPQEPLLEMLADLGIIHLGGTCREVTVHGVPIVLAGNELPWFGAAPKEQDLPSRSANGLPLRVLLAHGPDQFRWACDHDFDLMLAGHNHGGQIRFPLLGAVVAPSLSGTRYSCGVYRRGNTVLHVSRGTGSLTPIRWNCPPEIALLELVPGH
jgi:uncharacterized protein